MFFDSSRSAGLAYAERQIFALGLWLLVSMAFGLQPAYAQGLMEDIAFFGSIQDRSTGSPGAELAADHILKSFRDAGLTGVGVQKFLTPVPEKVLAALEVGPKSFALYPWGPNLVYLPMTPENGLSGPLVYVARGRPYDFDGKPVQGSIVVMEMDSSDNWLNAAMLGAKALIFLGSKESRAGEFDQKDTTTPLAFPRFWVRPEDGELLKRLSLTEGATATLRCRSKWTNKLVRNCYALLPGKDPKLRNELVVLDAFYDASSHLLGMAPGAGESTSAAALLAVARDMARNPPDRTVLFLATAGNGQSLAGMRQFIWAATARKKLLRKEKRTVSREKEELDRQVELLTKGDPFALKNEEDRQLVWQIVVEMAKDRADVLTRRIQYEMKDSTTQRSSVQNVDDPRPYRLLSWLPTMDDLSADQKSMALVLLNDAKPELDARHEELRLRTEAIRSSNALRDILDELEPVLYLSLYLSPESPYIGLSELGETYPVRENMRRIVRAARLADMISDIGVEVAKDSGLQNIVATQTRRRSSQEAMCCDVGVLAGLPAVSLMTMYDSHARWSTPNDTLDKVNKSNIAMLSGFLPPLLSRLFSQPDLKLACQSSIPGLSSLEGQTMFIRQGELFPDQPAPGTLISVLQGDSIFRAMSYRDGTFFMPGLANNRVSLEKLILEPYGLDDVTGRVAWTADKVQTRKVNYRIKAKSEVASTSLVMFNCEQTDVIGAFNPRDMGYLTRVDLLDSSTDAAPLRYWYSRVDGRNTTAVSIFLEPGTRFKLIMAPSLLEKAFLLLNSSPESPMGEGFLIGQPGTIDLAPARVATDLHLLLGERLNNLFKHGIVNQHLKALYETAGKELSRSAEAISKSEFSWLWKDAVPAWSHLDSIYSEVEHTQRDVLSGVMFFVALLVPFAYCMERYFFAFRTIYRQISAFFVFLLLAILALRNLNPAFQLTYSPMVVILAFFIVALSVLVSLIIFMRFEREMAELHSKASHIRTPRVSKWQAFGAGFAIGVSNLNRRKLRTALTCITLIILTFTVMSFTSVKSFRKTTQTEIADSASYRGILLRNQYRLSLTLLTLQELAAKFGGSAAVWPKGWIEPSRSSESLPFRLFVSDKSSNVRGILGVGSQAPEKFRNLVKYGSWFSDGEKEAVLLPISLARELGLDPERDVGTSILLSGTHFRVDGYFDGGALEGFKDLDQNPVTPAYISVSHNEELSEVEVEAMQSGEQILPVSERFQYADPDATIIIPFQTCLDLGGDLKTISILPDPGENLSEFADRLSSWLNYPLFIGDQATWYQSTNAALRYQGAANLVVPILIVIFITLNTMIGHVHERKREISTYTSVGLAPAHVGFLFIVEALSMAVISTVFGYILAQLNARYLGNSTLFSQLTFNYSSLASVSCMFLVFSVVFVAALYPARVAAEIAMPDVNRSWTLPPPEGDTLQMTLPFLMKYEEERGVMGFLGVFFSSHQSGAHETFIVDNANLIVDTPSIAVSQTSVPVCLLIRAKVWLAPFDFGIKQEIQLHCCPASEDPGYLEIAIRMNRLSGERSAWTRANKNFIKALRNQMLLWRLLDLDGKLHYQQFSPVEYAGQMGGSSL